jgi:hypothetical protein
MDERQYAPRSIATAIMETDVAVLKLSSEHGKVGDIIDSYHAYTQHPCHTLLHFAEFGCHGEFTRWPRRGTLSHMGMCLVILPDRVWPYPSGEAGA